MCEEIEIGKEKMEKIEGMAEELEEKVREIIRENTDVGYKVEPWSLYADKINNKESIMIDYMIYIMLGEIPQSCSDSQVQVIRNINEKYTMKKTIVKTPYFTIKTEPIECGGDYCKVGGWVTVEIKSIEPEIIKDFIPTIKQAMELIIPYSF